MIYEEAGDEHAGDKIKGTHGEESEPGDVTGELFACAGIVKALEIVLGPVRHVTTLGRFRINHRRRMKKADATVKKIDKILRCEHAK